jgi:hypothetical protein
MVSILDLEADFPVFAAFLFPRQFFWSWVHSFEQERECACDAIAWLPMSR